MVSNDPSAMLFAASRMLQRLDVRLARSRDIVGPKPANTRQTRPGRLTSQNETGKELLMPYDTSRQATRARVVEEARRIRAGAEETRIEQQHARAALALFVVALKRARLDLVNQQPPRS